MSYLTGTCYSFELGEFLAWFCVALVCRPQLGILVDMIKNTPFTSYACGLGALLID